jgi:4-amino-4-deoxy-L-arabinose transferase-like glycosyltransferase
MSSRLPRLLWLALPLAYFLYFFGISAAGVIGPDEPRYASIGHDMARTGDWITPRLWGIPWFEKPALLYWMIAAGFRSGLSPDLAPRLPVALLSLAFLGLFWWVLWREFSCMIAWASTLILATSAGWCLYSQSGVTDIPLSATFAAAMLLSIPWISKRDTRLLPVAAALFGAAVLAKGPIGIVLAAPLALRWRDLLDWLRPRALAPFLAVAAPWYLLCYWKNGRVFIDEFFWKHNLGRFTSPELQHGQPWWFYIPVLAVLFIPWTPLLVLVAANARAADSRRRFLLLWALWPLVFFSLSVNKLPGYILPALPAFAALSGIAVAEARSIRPALLITALFTAAFAVAAPLVDIGGIAHGARPAFSLMWLLPLPAAAAAWFLDARAKRLAAVASLASAATLGIVYLKVEMGAKFFSRELWREVQPRLSETCVERIDRSWRYGLNYYSVTPLPDCSADGRPANALPVHIRQSPGQPPRITRP